MPAVTPDADQYAAAAGLLAKGISSGHLPIPIVHNTADWTILYGGYAGLHISAAPGLSTVNCLPMRWWRDPQRLSMLW
jgi:hypothetical protein